MAESFFSGQIVGFFLLSLLVGAYVMQRLLPRLKQRVQAAGRLQMLGLLALTPQCSVALVQAGRETLVLGVTTQTVTLLMKTGQLASAETQPTEHEALSSSGEEETLPFRQATRAAL